MTTKKMTPASTRATLQAVSQRSSEADLTAYLTMWTHPAFWAVLTLICNVIAGVLVIGGAR